MDQSQSAPESGNAPLRLIHAFANSRAADNPRSGDRAASRAMRTFDASVAFCNTRPQWRSPKMGHPSRDGWARQVWSNPAGMGPHNWEYRDPHAERHWRANRADPARFRLSKIGRLLTFINERQAGTGHY